MGQLTDHVSRRRLLAGGAVVLTGGIASGVAQQADSESSTQTSSEPPADDSVTNRLLVENPTGKPRSFSLSVSKSSISAYRVTNRQGKTRTVGQSEGDDFDFPFAMEMDATSIEPANNVLFDREYTVESNSALAFRLQGMPKEGELLYTLKPKSKQAFVSTWGTMGCSSGFDVYLSPSESRNSCGQRLSELDEYDGANQHTIRLQNASQDG